MKEEYFGLMKKSGFLGNKPLTVFINPNKAEMREAGGKTKQVRYIIDAVKKDFYIWSAYERIHKDVIDHFGLKLTKHCRGMGEIDMQGKVTWNQADSHGVTPKWIDQNERWLSKYLHFDDFAEAIYFEEPVHRHR